MALDKVGCRCAEADNEFNFARGNELAEIFNKPVLGPLPWIVGPRFEYRRVVDFDRLRKPFVQFGSECRDRLVPGGDVGPEGIKQEDVSRILRARSKWSEREDEQSH